MQPEADRHPAPWRRPIAHLIRRCGEPGLAPLPLDALNAEADRLGVVTLSGHPVRFVAQGPDESSAADYERRIWETGEVFTRQSGRGACYDGFNALCWLAFPRVRARLNAFQALALGLGLDRIFPSERPLPGARGPLRDRVTLFDESGGLLVTRDRQLAAAFRMGDWWTLFVALRDRWPARANLLLVGHALHEKLLNPYKAICARVFWVDADPLEPLPIHDAQAAARLGQFLAEQPARRVEDPLQPLPVMGVPGWDPTNADPAFYRDPLVFRARSA
jgi:hypothetical protein